LPARGPASRPRRTGSKPNRAAQSSKPSRAAQNSKPNRAAQNSEPINNTNGGSDGQTFRTTGTVKTVLRDAKFLVETEQGMEVVARAAGRMRRGRKIRILAGDAVDLEVSLYDPTRGRIIWRHV
jgi:translation initiation factor IF-1